MTGPVESGDAPGTVRLDKWLWRARFFKTRTLAAKAVAAGLRVNGRRLEKAATPVRAGDVLTFAQAGGVRVVEIVALGERRGPAPEARALYVDRSEPPPAREGPRPTKRDRRALDALRADP